MNPFNNARYELLALQFKVPSQNSNLLNQRQKEALNRIFDYIYHHTDIFYLEFVNKEILYTYIKSVCSDNSSQMNIAEAVKDVKSFLFFMENIKKNSSIPDIDLSVNNLELWNEL